MSIWIDKHFELVAAPVLNGRLVVDGFVKSSLDILLVELERE
ncbi:MAG: hypothetical protein ACTHME_01450 [Candidatus Nitrosocosmicus sp.]